MIAALMVIDAVGVVVVLVAWWYVGRPRAEEEEQ